MAIVGLVGKTQIVQEYTDGFQSLVDHLDMCDIENKKALRYLIGLPHYIHVELDFLHITTLGQAFWHAFKIDEKFKSKLKYVR